MDATKTKPFNIEKKLVYDAYKAVKANAGAAGVDGKSLEMFDKDLMRNLYKIWNRMSSGSYFPPPVRAVPIPLHMWCTTYVAVCGADRYVAQSRFRFGARWNCEVLRHISVRLQRAQELHDIRLSGPAPGRLARSASIERRQSPLLGCEIGLCIDVGGVERYVAEPSADRVDVDPGLQQVRCGRMADHVRADPLAAQLRRGCPQPRDVALHHCVNAVSRDGLTAAVQKHGCIVGPLTSEATKLLDGGGPERATALLAALAQDADGSRVPIYVADPE